MSQSDEILYEIIAPHVATITLNRPQARNAWSDAMLPRMMEVLAQCERDPEVRVVILTGAGKSFCAGGDLHAMKNQEGMFAGDPVELRTRYTQGLQAITRRFEHFEKPIIAAVNGAAIGAGFDLSLMCDIRLGVELAKFGSTFAAVGLIPGDGGAYLLTRAVGFSRAVELILSARVFGAQEALSLGVIHELCADHEALMQRALERATQMSKLPPSALRMAKVALYRSYNQSPEVALQLTAALQGLVQRSPEHEAAVDRMLAKISSK